MPATEQVQEQQEKKNQQPPEIQTKVGTKLDTTELKTEVKDKSADKETTLSEEQQKTKEELEADIAKGMKVSEAVGKRSTRLDNVDAWCNILPFVGDGSFTSASMLFFMVQNQKLAKKYRLPLSDKLKAALLQAGDLTLKTILKAPLNVVMSIPVIGRLSYPLLAPINATVGFISDKIFKDNKLTAKLFKKSFENMLADAKKWNAENPDKEQIDIVTMQQEIATNMAKIGKLNMGTPTKEKKIEKTPTQNKPKHKESEKSNQAQGGTSAPTTEKPKDTPEAIVAEQEKSKTPTATPDNNTNTTNPNITSVNYEYVDKK